MANHDILAATQSPDVEVTHLLDSVQSLDVIEKLHCVDIFRGCLHYNCCALQENWDSRDQHKHREKVSGNGISNLPVGPEFDYNGSGNDANGLDHVAEDMNDGGFHVHVAVFVAAFLLILGLTLLLLLLE